MMKTIPEKLIIQQLGDGLVLRRGCKEDAGQMADFNGHIHPDPGVEFDQRVATWTRDLLRGDHPTFRAEDFTIVEDVNTGKIVSSCNHISQLWHYAGIPIKVGRPELVGTDPAYRRRGLVRKQFDVLHRWSQERGELMQGITGIPNYYRMFGYEMAVNLDGWRMGFEKHLPKLKKDESEPFIIRKARKEDVSFLSEVYRGAARHSLLVCLRDEALFEYELTGMSKENAERKQLAVIQTPEGKPVGMLGYPHFLWGTTQSCVAYELLPGISWLETTPSVIRFLWQTGQAAARKEKGTCDSYEFYLSLAHPVFKVAAIQLVHGNRPYAWYVRVPDLPAFLKTIASVLEKRLAESIIVGYTGELKLDFYTTGLRMVFEKGRLSVVENSASPGFMDASACFPELTSLQLLFSYRSLDELDQMYADCYAQGEATLVLETLFPKMPSMIWPIC
jgi:hypothetical protein